jgi:hypothetical protein
MVMTRNPHDSRSDQYTTLLLMADTCRKAANTLDEQMQSDEEMELGSLLEEAIVESALNDDDLMRLWAVSLLCAQIAKRLYVASTETYPDAGQFAHANGGHPHERSS